MSVKLSTREFARGVQCPKIVWMDENMPDKFDTDVSRHLRTEHPSDVLRIVREYFPGAVQLQDEDIDIRDKKTRNLLKNGKNTVINAAFSCNDLICDIDIIKTSEKNSCAIYEIKDSSHLKNVYYIDACFNYYVLTKLGFNVEKVCIIYVNNKYIRKQELDVGKFLMHFDATGICKKNFHTVEKKIGQIRACMLCTDEQTYPIGKQCNAPYKCGYFPHCTANLPKPNVFDVASMNMSSKLKYFNQGIVSFPDLYNLASLSKNHRQQIKHEIYNLEDEICMPSLKEFLQKLHYPMYFLDFEAYQPPIPLYENTKPHEQLVFQYSLHYKKSPHGELQHKEFLAKPGTDPRRAIAQKLTEDIPDDACVVVYNKSFEKGRIANFADLFSDLAPHLMKIHANIVDLMIPFQKRIYYSKGMKGLYSLKYVLPALFPDDPSLHYENLDGIHNGNEACNSYRDMLNKTEQEQEILRRELLSYCALDTLALVKIVEKLEHIAESGHNDTKN